MVKTLIESFRYPRRGPGMMWEACARKIIENGGHVRMDRKVETLHWDTASSLWTVGVVKGDGARESYKSRHVVSSAPVRDLVSSITPGPMSMQRAREMRYRDFHTVVQIGEARAQLDDNWVYIHDPAVKVGRVQNFRSWSPELIPDETSTSLGLEYFCFEGDGLWTSDDQNLIALAKKEIGKIGLMRPEDVTDACVVRQPKAYPVYDDTYADNMDVVRRDLAAHYPTLHLVGRNGMHKYNNQDHAMMTGLLTGLNIAAGETLYDVWQVNEDAEYHEAGPSGIEDALKSERLVPRKVAKTA
jgi:protoporphyrinogen oxidase